MIMEMLDIITKKAFRTEQAISVGRFRQISGLIGLNRTRANHYLAVGVKQKKFKVKKNLVELIE